MAVTARVTSHPNDDSNQLSDLEAGQALHLSQASTATGRQQRMSKARKTSTMATSEQQSSKAEKDEDEKLWAEVYEKIEDASYEKYPEGWPRLASFLDGCANFSIFRRFGQCTTRILLDHSTRITMLEKQLDDLDKSDALPNGNRYRLRNVEVGPDTFKKDLLASIEERIRKYYELLLLYSQVRGMGQTSKSDYDHVFHWMHQDMPVDQGQYNFIYHRDDFVSAVPRQRRNAIEALIWKYLTLWPNSWFMRTLGLDKSSTQPKEETVKYLSKERILVAAKLIVAVLAVTVLFIPIALFLLVPMSKACMSITVFVFLVVSALMMTSVAEVGVQEIFIGTATYGAVVVTFLGNLQNSLPTTPG